MDSGEKQRGHSKTQGRWQGYLFLTWGGGVSKKNAISIGDPGKKEVSKTIEFHPPKQTEARQELAHH